MLNEVMSYYVRNNGDDGRNGYINNDDSTNGTNPLSESDKNTYIHTNIYVPDFVSVGFLHS